MYGISPLMQSLPDIKRLQKLRIDDPHAYAVAVSAFVTERLVAQGIIKPSPAQERECEQHCTG